MKLPGRAAILSCCALACGCSVTPLESPHAVKILKDFQRLERTVAIRVHTMLEAYGSTEEWEKDLILGLKSLDACAGVLVGKASNHSDLLLEITVKTSTPASPRTLPSGGVLEFLAWSIIPLLPLWIPDVDVSPGVELQIDRVLHYPERASHSPWPGVVRQAGMISTCYLERYPFLSWQTLGAILVPPFFFKAGDPEHVARRNGERVRLELSVLVAEIVKSSSLGPEELVRDLMVNDDLLLSYVPDERLRKVTISLYPEETVPAVDREQEVDLLELRWPPGQRRSVSLRKLLEGRREQPVFVRLEAIGKDGPPLRYSTRLKVPSLWLEAPVMDGDSVSLHRAERGASRPHSGRADS